MPGYTIHLAIGKIYSQNNKIEDVPNFYKGIIAPDIFSNKAKSHYGPNSSNPGLNSFIKANGISSSYREGYFLHLLTDYLFYNKFLTTWSPSIYDDYNILNLRIKQKYNIIIPEEIQKDVKFENGKLTVLKEESLYKFIENVGKINIREIVSKRNINLEDVEYNEME